MISGHSIVLKRFLTLAAVTAGAAGLAWAQTPSANPPTTPPPATAPSTRPGFPPVAATVNGETLSRDDFQVALEMVAGPRVFDEILSMVVAQQACQAGGITVGAEQIKVQRDRAYAGLRAQGIPENQLDQALLSVIQRQGLSPFEFDMTLRRQACIVAMSKGHGEVTDAQVDQAYRVETGTRYVLIDTRIEPSQAAQLRKLVETDKKSIQEAGQSLGFAQQAITISEFATAKEVPQVIIDQTKKLKKGELSPMLPLGDNNMHMLFMQEVIPPTQVKPTEVTDFKAKLKTRLIDASEAQWGQDHLRDLISKARIDIQDPVLLQLYQQINAARAAQAAAASQPATQAAPAAPK